MEKSMEEFDFDAFDRQFEEEYSDENENEDISDEGEEPDTGADVADDLTNEDEEDAPPSREENPQKHDAAFADMRRRLQETESVAAFVQKMAEENGMTVEEIIENYEKARIEQEAQKQGVPPELLARQQKTEQELEQLRNEQFTQRFNAQVESTMEKYGANEQDVEAVFAYAAQEGLIDSLKSGATTFEAAYKLAHMDKLIEQKAQEAVQKNLSNKKKRQEEAPIPTGGSSIPTEQSDEDKAIADAKALVQDGFF